MYKRQILFLLLLALSFGVAFYFLRPTRAETAVQQQLANIEESRTTTVAGTTILKQQKQSSTLWLDEVIKQFPGSTALSQLIRQSRQKVNLGSLVIFSLLATVIASWLATSMIPSFALSLCLGVAVGLSPILYLYTLREVRFRRIEALLPEAVDLMARGLRAGHGVGAVLEMVGQEVADPVGCLLYTSRCV